MLNIPWYLRMTFDTAILLTPLFIMKQFPASYYEIVRNKRMLRRRKNYDQVEINQENITIE